jgi:cytochrome b561
VPRARGSTKHMWMRDTPAGYGLVSRVFHWLMALAIVAMFGLGLWMVDLDYYSPYYHSAPSIHKSVGILLLIALALRFGWRLANVRPDDADLTPVERTASRIVHWAFYPLLLTLMVSGYLISTADGRPIDVFDWFSVPSPGENKGLEDTAGAVHTVLAYIVILLAAVHAAAAVKHHIVDRGRSLSRMWSGPPAT